MHFVFDGLESTPHEGPFEIVTAEGLHQVEGLFPRHAPFQWIKGVLFTYGDSIEDKTDDTWAQIDMFEPEVMTMNALGGRWFGYNTNGYHNPNIGGPLRYLDDGNTPQAPEDDVWTDYTPEDGMPFDDKWGVHITDIQIDGFGDIWMMGNESLGMVHLCSLDDNDTPKNKSDDTWTYYSTNDGWPARMSKQWRLMQIPIYGSPPTADSAFCTWRDKKFGDGGESTG